MAGQMKQNIVVVVAVVTVLSVRVPGSWHKGCGTASIRMHLFKIRWRPVGNFLQLPLVLWALCSDFTLLVERREGHPTCKNVLQLSQKILFWETQPILELVHNRRPVKSELTGADVSSSINKKYTALIITRRLVPWYGRVTTWMLKWMRSI